MFFVAWLVRVLLEGQLPVPGKHPLGYQLVSQPIRVAVWGLLPWLWCRAVDREPLSAAWGRSRGAKRTIVAALIGIGYVLSSRAIEVMSGGAWLGGTGPRLAGGEAWTAALLGLAGPVMLEEYLFRGIVFRRLARLLPTVVAVVVSSLAFVAAHLPGWLILGHVQGPALLWRAGSVALLGCLLALLYRVAGTLAVPMAVHAANNILSGWRL